MADYTIVDPQGPISTTASAAVTGGQLVEVSGDNTVGPAGAGSIKVVGQALHDAAITAPVTVYARGPIREATVSGAGVVAGVRLKAAAAGKVALFVDGTDAITQDIGIALAAAADATIVRYIGL
ncbi:MAG TPA: capsid cement protein [Marmoricola sp.]|jgi:hypothetical protein|nr:capsid cement protein [Marmoricola sp.]